MKRKYLILWLLVLSLLLLGGCGGKDEEADAEAGDEQKTEETEEADDDDGQGKGSVLEFEEVDDGNDDKSEEESDGDKDKDTDGGEGGDSSTGGALTVMTLDESVGYLEGLSPELLGLPGASMSEYEIYSAEQMVPVNGITCAKLSVYSRGTSDTNTFQGVFLLARDGTRLYRLENETEVVEIPLAPKTIGGAAEE